MGNSKKRAAKTQKPNKNRKQPCATSLSHILVPTDASESVRYLAHNSPEDSLLQVTFSRHYLSNKSL